MSYRQLEGISKSGLNALWTSVSKFKQYLDNTHEPFQSDHFLLGQLVEDKLIGNVELVNEKYTVKDLSFPKEDSIDGKIFQLLLSSKIEWNDISDDTKIYLTDQAGMNSKYRAETRIKKVDALEDLYKTYWELYQDNKYLVPSEIDNKSNELVLAIKSSQFRGLLDYTYAKYVLTRVVDGVTIKGELDWIIINEEEKHIVISDLKTYGQKATKDGWLYQCLKYDYFEQAYNYVELVKTNYPGYTVSFAFLVVDVMNTVFTHYVTEQELNIGYYGYTYIEGEAVNVEGTIGGGKTNKYPGFQRKFENYKWYIDNYGEDVDIWPDVHPSLLKQKFLFNGVL